MLLQSFAEVLTMWADLVLASLGLLSADYF